MTESDKHRQAKLVGRWILQQMGIEGHKIKEEQEYRIEGKRYVADLLVNVEDSPLDKSIVVECGKCNKEEDKKNTDEIILIRIAYDAIEKLAATNLQMQTEFKKYMRSIVDEKIEKQDRQIQELFEEMKNLKRTWWGSELRTLSNRIDVLGGRIETLRDDLEIMKK